MVDLRIEFCREDGHLWAINPYERKRAPLNRSAKRSVARAVRDGRRVIFDFMSIQQPLSVSSLLKLLYQTRDLMHLVRDLDTLVYLEGLPTPMQHALAQRLDRGVSAVGALPPRSKEPQIIRYPMVVCFDAWARSEDLKADIEALIARDGDRCAWCGLHLSATDRCATLDHVIPRAMRGPNAVDNYLLSCSSCNNARQATPAASWLLACLTNGQHAQVAAVLSAIQRTGLQLPTLRQVPFPLSTSCSVAA